MKLYTIDQAADWNQYVKTFRNWDVYYLCEYAVSLMLHGDGMPLLICYEDDSSRMCYVVMKRDISCDVRFENSLEKNTYFDFTTPYGYGGPLVEGSFGANSQQAFLSELIQYCKSENIVSQFVRFHPLLSNQAEFSVITQNRYVHDTIFMDTSSAELILNNMDGKNRNMIRKAYNTGIQVVKRPADDYTAFFDMYRKTMQKHDADEYYYFRENYFDFIKDALNENAAMFYALLAQKPIAGAMFLFNKNMMHYHLASVYQDYRSAAAGNILLYEAALWASKNGTKQLHLGGGLNNNDSLFGFKKQFNKYGRVPFYIGKTIFDQAAYDMLLDIREAISCNFQRDNDFLIQYRR